MMTLTERAGAYVAAMPPAISGQGGHQATFAVASALVHGFALYEEQAWPIMCEYNARCSPPWSETELRHKLVDAFNLTRHPQPRGYLSGITHRHAIGFSRPEIRVYKLAPLLGEKPEDKEAGVTNQGPSSQKTVPPPTDSKISVASAAKSGEAKRLAGELLKLHRDGAISGPGDPEAEFYAQVIHTFGGTYTPTRPEKKEDPTGSYVLTKQQLLIVPPGLTHKEPMKFLQDDHDKAIE
jgi:hypothetical protein